MSAATLPEQVCAVELPSDSQLTTYRDTGYTDCFATEVPLDVSLAQFIQAFYTTPLFTLERRILGLMALHSTDDEALSLAEGHRNTFAAWTVEERDADQILLAAGQTRSWLSVVPIGAAGTRLHFGSAVVPRYSPDGEPSMGFGFQALGGVHRLYSRALLRSARRRLLATR